MTILHLSDLHFGNKNRFTGTNPKNLASEFHRALQKELELARFSNVDLVIVTGDFAEEGKPAEFEAARIFLRTLAEAVGVPVTRFVFVPGNHDINWIDCRGLRGKLGNSDISASEFPELLMREKFRRYDNFTREFYELAPEREGSSLADLESLGSWCSSLGLGAWLFDYNDLNLSVAALNSSEREDDQNPGGYLSPEQAQSLMVKWEATQTTRLRIIAIHHNPIATTEGNTKWSSDWIAQKVKTTDITEDGLRHYTSDLVGFEGRERLQAIVSDCNVHLVLHGHHHDSGNLSSWPCGGDQHCAILSAGSFGLQGNQLPGDAPLSCQIISFITDPENPRLKAIPLVFDPRHRISGSVIVGGFRSQSSSNAVYDKPLVLPTGWPVAGDFVRPTCEPSPALRFRHFELQREIYSSANLGGLYSPGEKDRSDDIKVEQIFVEPSLIAFRERIIKKRNRPKRNSFSDASQDQPEWSGFGSIAHNSTFSRAASASVKDDSAFARWDQRLESDCLAAARSMENEEAIGQGNSASAELTTGTRPLIILGEPGSGKSSLLHWHLLRQLAAWVSSPTTTPLPVYVRLSVWEKDCQPPTKSITTYAQEVIEKDLGVQPGSLAQWLAPHSRVIWLLDGVDEVRDSHRRRLLLDELRNLPERNSLHRWVVTSRPTGYRRGTLNRNQAQQKTNWSELELAPLNNEQALALLANWSRLLEKLDRRAVFDSITLFTSLTEQTGLSRLRRNPLLLTMIVLFYRDSKRLPDHRWEFYEHAARALRRSWITFRSNTYGEDTDESLSSVLNADWLQPVLTHLASLAMRMEEVVFTGTELREEVETALLERNYTRGEAEIRCDTFIDRALKIIGVFVEKGTDRFGFLHLTFQEYYAAEWLIQHEPEAAQLIEEKWAHPDWQETWDLYVLGLAENATKLDAMQVRVGNSNKAMEIRLRWLGLGFAPFPLSGPRNEVMLRTAAALSQNTAGQTAVGTLAVLARWERRYPQIIIEGLAAFVSLTNNDQAHAAARILGEQAEGRELRAELLRMLCGSGDDEAHRLRGFAEYALTLKSESRIIRQALLDVYGGKQLDCGTVPNLHAQLAGARALKGEVPAVSLWGPPRLDFRTIEINSVTSITFIKIPAGVLFGGIASKQPVEITKPFWIAQTPITQAQWEALMGSNPSHFKGEHLPVENISWHMVAGPESNNFLHTLANHPEFVRSFGDSSVSLPTEMQWEYACRAGTMTDFNVGNQISSHQANFNASSAGWRSREGVNRAHTTVAGSFPPNAWGLHDMHGNVWEWCKDTLCGYPAIIPRDYCCELHSDVRVMRGGSWIINGDSSASWYRFGFNPSIATNRFGVRPCVNVD